MPAAVALLSAATLAFEILLVRLFAIEQFHHFAYMAIGIAMLGFGASGTLVTLWQPTTVETLRRRFVAAALLTALALVAAPILADFASVDVTQLALDRTQWLKLAALYLALALPFGSGALAILLAIARRPDRPGGVYGASFVGSAVGSLAALGVLGITEPVRALALPALLGATGAIVAAWSAGTPRGWRAGSVVAATLAIGAGVKPPWSLDLTPYKGLPQVEAYPDARRIAETSSPVGWVVAVEAPAFHHAPGLSLAYTGAFPGQAALFVDGQLAGAVVRGGSASADSLIEWLPAALPYALGRSPRVLVVGAGEGTDVRAALHFGAQRVTALELHPALIALQRASLPARWDPARRVEWVSGDARRYVARTDEDFDLIAIGPAGGFGASAGGLHSIGEDYLHTVDAYAAYLERLAPGGVLAITRWLVVPPRDEVRVVLTAARALRRIRPNAYARGLVVVRSWGTVTTLVEPDGFSDEALGRLERWLAERRFDEDWRPGLIEPPASRFNRIADPALYRAAAAAMAGDEAVRAFVTTYPFVVEPVDDARPYPHQFLDLPRASRLLRADRGDWLSFADWGYLALGATLVQSVVLAATLILLPAAFCARARSPGLLPVLIYFAAIGWAYLAAEIAAIQQLTLLLGHPVYAVATVLAVILAGSGLGSVWSDRFAAGRPGTAGAALAAAFALYALLLLGAVHPAQGWPTAVRVGLALAIIGPPACAMGMPFPTGLRALAGTDRTKIAWAWAVNGFTSVVAAPLSALIALEAGTRALFATAAAGYAVAAVVSVAGAQVPSRGQRE